MTQCLSDRALARVLSDMGTPDERAHLAACDACAGRYRRLEAELAAIVGVLGDTPEPRHRVVPGAWRWVTAAAALAAVAVGVLFSMEIGPRTEIGPRAPAPSASEQDRQVAIALADIASTLFSVDGEPGRPVAALEPDEAHEAGCGTTTGSDRIDVCADGGLGLGEETGALDLEIDGDASWLPEDRVEGD